MATNLSGRIPDFPLPPGYASHDKYLTDLVAHGAEKRYGASLPSARQRIDHELSLIQRLGFAKYYLIVHDILRASREMDAWVGPGRGNAAGSVVAYCLDITAMDPLRYGLLFERVLHPDWNTLPDIDSDMDVETRPKLVDWVNHQYKGSVLITEYDHVQAEQAGVLQVDIIGKTWFSMLKLCFNLIRDSGQVDFITAQISPTNEKTLALFQQGDTGGIPLFDQPGMQAYLKELVPVSYEQLVTLYALYNCGEQGYTQRYIQSKNSVAEMAYALPELKDVLHETSGELVYQEQIMVLSQTIAGFSPEDSDRLRRALQKKKNASLRPGFQQAFIMRGKSNGFDTDVLEKTWTEWETRGEFLFNKSHAVSFTWIAWQLAYVKSHYPAVWLQALKNKL